MTLRVFDDATGAPRAPGSPGTPGIGVPPGGATGLALLKNSSTDFDTGWFALGIPDISGLADALDSKQAEGDYQPLDSDLTAIAALTTTNFGRALLTLTNAAALREAAGLDLYRVGFWVTGTPSASEVLLAHVATDAFTIPADLTGSRVAGMASAVNPAASFVLSLRKNGVQFGTITISTGGVVTLAAASATSFAPGDVLTVLGPAVADTAFANWALTLRGTI